MYQFVGDYVKPQCERAEPDTIAVAIDHLRAVPERVVEINVVVYGGDDRSAGTVDPVAVVIRVEVVVNNASIIVGGIYRSVVCGTAPLYSFQRTW